MKYLRLMIMLCVTGCALPHEPERTLYEITPENVLPSQATGSPHKWGILRIAMPHSVAGLGSERIQVQESDGSLTWVKNAEWIAPPAKMLEPLLVRDLESSGLFTAVIDSHSSVNAAFDLQTNVERFTLVEADKTGAAHVEIALRYSLVKIPENSLLASRLVVSSEPIETLRMTYVVSAFEMALRRCFQEGTDTIRALR
jgi:cholesterol transport system auxiliary component